MSRRSHHFLRGTSVPSSEIFTQVPVEQRRPDSINPGSSRQPDLSRLGYINPNIPTPSSPARSGSPTFLFQQVVRPDLGPQFAPPRPSSADTVIIAAPDDAISETSSSGGSLSIQEHAAPVRLSSSAASSYDEIFIEFSDTESTISVEELIIVNGQRLLHRRQGPCYTLTEDEMTEFIGSVPSNLGFSSQTPCAFSSTASSASTSNLVPGDVDTLLSDAAIIFLQNGALTSKTRVQAECLNAIQKIHPRSLRGFINRTRRIGLEEFMFKIALNKLTRRVMNNK